MPGSSTDPDPDPDRVLGTACAMALPAGPSHTRKAHARLMSVSNEGGGGGSKCLAGKHSIPMQGVGLMCPLGFVLSPAPQGQWTTLLGRAGEGTTEFYYEIILQSE